MSSPRGLPPRGLKHHFHDVAPSFSINKSIPARPASPIPILFSHAYFSKNSRCSVVTLKHTSYANRRFDLYPDIMLSDSVLMVYKFTTLPFDVLQHFFDVVQHVLPSFRLTYINHGIVTRIKILYAGPHMVHAGPQWYIQPMQPMSNSPLAFSRIATSRPDGWTFCNCKIAKELHNWQGCKE